MLHNNLVTQTNRSYAISPLLQILITLRFYATDTFQCVLDDLVNVTQPTVLRVVKSVTYEIANLSSEFIKMPETIENIRKTKSGFFELGGFPNILGCVDGTYIKIQSPGGDNGELYRNRKTFFFQYIPKLYVIQNTKLLILMLNGLVSTVFTNSFMCLVKK